MRLHRTLAVCRVWRELSTDKFAGRVATTVCEHRIPMHLWEGDLCSVLSGSTGTLLSSVGSLRGLELRWGQGLFKPLPVPFILGFFWVQFLASIPQCCFRS
eukprot:4774154-Amphidinium_carterae.1